MEQTPFIVGVFMIVGGILLIVYGRRRRALVQLAQAWPRVSGRMTRIDKTGVGNRIIGTSDYRRYLLNVEYMYIVNAQKYKGTRIKFGADLTVKKDIDAFCAKYKKGKEIMVHHDPLDHSTSVLMLKSPSGKDNPEIFFGGLLIVVGVALSIIKSGLLA
jgi:hypothetical protein